MAWSAYTRFGVFFYLTATMIFCQGCGTTGKRRVAPSSDEALLITALELDSEQSDFAEALAHFGAGIIREGLRDPSAISNYVSAVALAPDQLAPSLYAASMLLKSGEYADAVDVIQNFCDNNPGSMEARLWLGRFALQASGFYDEDAEYKKLAESAFRAAVDIEPGNEEGYLHLASFYSAGSSEAKALAVLDEAVEKLDNPVNALRMKADLLLDSYAQSKGRNRKLLDQAIAAMEKAKACPRDELTDAYLEKLAEAYGATTKGAETYLELYANTPGDIRFIRNAAIIFDNTGDTERAIEAFTKAAGYDTGDYPEIHHRLAELHLLSENIEKAASVYEKAVENYPENTSFYIRWARIYIDTDIPSSIDIIKAGIEQNPGAVELKELLATMLILNEEPEEAFELYGSILSIIESTENMFPSALFFLNYGLAADASENYEKALHLYRRAISMDPDLHEAYLRSALVHLRLENKPAAIAMMEIMLAADRENPVGLYYLGIINNRMELYEKALEAFGKAKSFSDESDDTGLLTDSGFYFNYGAAAERTKNYDKAERLFRKAIKLNSDNHEALNYLAYMWAEQDTNLDEALEFVLRALEFVPDSGAYIDTLGWIYYKQGRYEEALEKILEAFELMPDDPIIADHIGDVYKALGNDKKAVKYWQISHEHDPDNEDVEKKLLDAGVLNGDPENNGYN